MSFANPKTKRKYNTIGAQLTLWGTIVTFGVCATLCAVLYVGVFFSLREEIDAFIEGEVYEFLAGINEHGGDDKSLQADIRRELEARTFGDLAFRMYDKQGRVMITSELNDPLASYWKPGKNQPDRPTFETLLLPESKVSLRLCSLRTTLSDDRECIAQASYSLEHMDASLVVLRRICGAALLFSIAVSIVVGRFLATRSLRPMQRIAADAQRINPERLDERIRLSGTGDEFDQLVTIFNDLLAHTERYVTQLRQFTADASHELRSPLAALRGMTEVALSNEQSVEEFRRVLEDNISHYDRLQRIAEDLLIIAQLEAGEQILRPSTLELGKVIQNVVDLYRPMAEEQGIELFVSRSEDVTIVADSARVKQVVCNLIDNAIKYTLHHGRVSVSVFANENSAHIMFEDTGIGIAPDSLPRVFDRFYRSDQARTSTNGVGSGLGLSICKSIVEAHGGEIRIDSVLGKGTSITVSLPPVGARFDRIFQNDGSLAVQKLPNLGMSGS